MPSPIENNHTFPSGFSAVLDRIDRIDPIHYGKTRNYIDGAVTYLSPYISRGVISTKFVYNEVLKKGYNPSDIEKFIQELAWRDYWQQIWIAKKEGVNSDLKHKQKDVSNYQMSKAILEGNTGIEVIDRDIKLLYETGYMHNHVRMYTASVACNVAGSHWKIPAQWLYYYLLDGDWASNALSWQWVAGANSNKKYYANQENINTYGYTNQKGSFLDVDYSVFQQLERPEVLKETVPLLLTTELPSEKEITIDSSLPTLIYNSYNLDPKWNAGISANRILLLEPSHFKSYPISGKSIEFILALSENITTIQIFVGEFKDLINQYNLNQIYFKEHPLNRHYKGTEESRDWMFDVRGYYPSFFAFWKKCKKQLKLKV